MLILWGIIYLIFIFVDLIPLFKKKNWKPFWIYTVILTFAFALTVAFSFNIKIPSPSYPIEVFIKYLVGLS
jgi:hypothetical protein